MHRRVEKMVWKKSLFVGVVAAALVVTAGCSKSDNEHPAGQSSSASVAPSSAPSAEAHNDADVMFAQILIPHHSQAVEMSGIVQTKQGVDARVSELANAIEAAQGPEIAQMQGWLSQWGSPSMLSGHSGHGAGMAGMVSEQDIIGLKNAPGPEAGKLFLTQMIAHHQGAIAMAQDEIRTGQYPPAIALAQSVVTTQQKEIDTMKAILATM